MHNPYREENTNELKTITTRSIEKFMAPVAKETRLPNSERAELVDRIVKRINLTRTGKFKPVTFRQINGQLRDFGTEELYALFRKCEKGKTFGALFWYFLKQLRNGTAVI